MKINTSDRIIRLMYNHRKERVRKKNLNRFLKYCKKVRTNSMNRDKWLGGIRLEDVSIETLAMEAFMHNIQQSRYYIIHKIKEETDI